MVENTYARFKKSEDILRYEAAKREIYNKVHCDDFDYMNFLGAGGYGRVVRARKKTTGIHYALKVQSKMSLIKIYDGADLARVTTEREVLAHCHHPFIVGMQYAFAEGDQVILGLDLARGGDLQGLLNKAPDGLPENQVSFYMAEVLLALTHLHQMGIVYRDLKPCNVLLDEDGHVRLTDMGLAAKFRMGGEVKLERSENKKGGQHHGHGHSKPASEPTAPPASGADERHHEEHKTRAFTQDMRRVSTVGTYGFKAPEIVRLADKSSRTEHGLAPTEEDLSIGYGPSVDFWAFGVTLYALLSHQHPFKEHTHDKKGLFEGLMHAAGGDEDEVKMLHRDVIYTPAMSAEAKSLIAGLLDKDPAQRLGCRGAGVADVMGHPFFKGIDWDELMAKHVRPPFIPEKQAPFPEDEPPKFSSFKAFMAAVDAADVLKMMSDEAVVEEVPPRYEKYFEKWDFISPATLKEELGIARAMKAKQIMTIDAHKNSSLRMNVGVAAFSASSAAAIESSAAVRQLANNTETGERADAINIAAGAPA
jgi:serine/threonine protein kinase